MKQNLLLAFENIYLILASWNFFDENGMPFGLKLLLSLKDCLSFRGKMFVVFPFQTKAAYVLFYQRREVGSQHPARAATAVNGVSKMNGDASSEEEMDTN